MMRLFLTCWLLLAALCAGPAAAQADLPPRPDGPVYDGAAMLSAQTEAALDQRLRAYNQETGRTIVVATVSSLGGETIEPYATRLFETWGIGGEKRDTGLLLLVARDDRRMRIEVGYGLHPYFGGIMAGRVVNDVITPRFKAGDFDGGVTEGVDAILDHLANSPEDAVAIEEAQQAAEQARQSRDGGFPIGAIIWIAFILFFFVLPMLRGRGRKRRFGGGRRGRAGPWGNAARDIILWEAGKAIARGLSDSDDWGGGGGFGGGGFGGGGGGFGGFGGGMSGGGGASGGW